MADADDAVLGHRPTHRQALIGAINEDGYLTFSRRTCSRSSARPLLKQLLPGVAPASMPSPTPFYLCSPGTRPYGWPPPSESKEQPVELDEVKQHCTRIPISTRSAWVRAAWPDACNCNSGARPRGAGHSKEAMALATDAHLALLGARDHVALYGARSSSAETVQAATSTCDVVLNV